MTDRDLTPAVTDADREAALRDFPQSLEQVERLIARARAEEAERWGARLDFFHDEFGADGSGCDSGDPLDVIVSEARQVIVRLTDERDEARAEGAASEREALLLACREVVVPTIMLHDPISRDAFDEGVSAVEDAIRARGEQAAK